ncbi:sensor domain-containing protein, partial [Actinospica durhamensis]
MAGKRWDGLARDVGRGLFEALLAVLAGIALLVAAVVGVALTPLGVGVPAARAALLGVRVLAQRQRRNATERYDVPIAQPYRRDRPVVLRDPATWRDLRWLAVEIPVGLVLGLMPLIFAGGAVNFVVLSAIWAFRPWPEALIAVPALLFAGALARLAPAAARGALRLHALACANLLAPSRRALATRVEGLTRSRAEVLDASALELRRIERDLHDGAQARLAALGLSIGLAEQLVHARPDEAVQILAEARASGDQALADLRSLVRGILPPVLAERGLAGAVAALAAAMPLEVEVGFEPGITLSAPAESALYFAIAEALANVAKHSAARRATVRVRRAG